MGAIGSGSAIVGRRREFAQPEMEIADLQLGMTFSKTLQQFIAPERGDFVAEGGPIHLDGEGPSQQSAHAGMAGEILAGTVDPGAAQGILPAAGATEARTTHGGGEQILQELGLPGLSVGLGMGHGPQPVRIVTGMIR